MNSLSFWSLILCLWIELLAIWWICKVYILPKTELSQNVEKYILLSNWIVQSMYSRKDSIKERNFYKDLTFSGTWVNLNAKICSEPTLWSPMELRVKMCPSLANHQLPEGDFASVTWLISHFDTLIENNVEMKHNWKEIEKYCPNLQFSQSISQSS